MISFCAVVLVTHIVLPLPLTVKISLKLTGNVLDNCCIRILSMESHRVVSPVRTIIVPLIFPVSEQTHGPI